MLVLRHARTHRLLSAEVKTEPNFPVPGVEGGLFLLPVGSHSVGAHPLELLEFLSHAVCFFRLTNCCSF